MRQRPERERIDLDEAVLWSRGRPSLFDCGQNSRLVVDQDVMAGRIALLDVAEFLLFVDVDQYAALDRLKDAGALDLARLEDDVAIGQDDSPTQPRIRSRTSSAPGYSRLANG